MLYGIPVRFVRMKRGLFAMVAGYMVLQCVPAMATDIEIASNRATLVQTARPMGEVIVVDPTVADARAHGTTHLSIIGKKPGSTTLRIFDKDHNVLQSYTVRVGYDLVEMRRALKNFLPDEAIGVEAAGDSVALTGNVTSAEAADKAVRVAGEIIKQQQAAFGGANAAGSSTGIANPSSATSQMASGTSSPPPGILNFMKVTNGQQVMLRVRVGEIQRSALKALGVDLQAVSASGTSLVALGTGGGIASLVDPGASATAVPLGSFLLPGGQQPTNTQGILSGRWQPHGANGDTLAGLIKALEQDGLFKLLAEPNLVAVSGEEAEFLAGGEIPIPVPQGAGGGTNTVTIQYKPYGVAIRFKPLVLSGNHIHMEVQPEVSELDPANALTINGFRVPAISTRRAKTTVELAAGESFMIAGLIKDESRSTINQLPGVKELPILGALFRSTEFQRNETELVIAVTPYTVDPMRNADVRLPTDNFAPASDMEMYFYGALGSMQGGKATRTSQSPSVEGPIGFMVD